LWVNLSKHSCFNIKEIIKISNVTIAQVDKYLIISGITSKI